MNDKKVTMKDIALEAGVSSATVSYVLNYSEKEKISHETRLKVFEAARRLRYVPDMTAKTLANKKSRLVGVIVNLGRVNLPSKLCQYYELIDALQAGLYRIGYDTVLLSTSNLNEDIQIGQRRSFDAAFILDLDTAALRETTHRFFCPLIIIDGHLGDPLFYEVTGDYEALFAQEAGSPEGTFVLMEDYSSDSIYACARRHVPPEHLFINRPGGGLDEFLASRQGMRGIVVGEVLGLQAESRFPRERLTVVVGQDDASLLHPDTRRVLIASSAKAGEAIRIMRGLLALEPGDEEPQTIRIAPVWLGK